MTLAFSGANGRKPSTEARRYVYRIIAAMIDNSDERRWFFDGIENEFDRRRLKRALELVQREMLRKGNK